MRISDWSSDVCSSDLDPPVAEPAHRARAPVRRRFAAPVAFDHAGFPREAFHPDPGGAPAAAARADQKGALGPEVAEHQVGPGGGNCRSEEHTSELQSLMRISYAVFCLKKKNR